MDLDNFLTDQLTGTTFEVGDVHFTAAVPAVTFGLHPKSQQNTVIPVVVSNIRLVRCGF